MAQEKLFQAAEAVGRVVGYIPFPLPQGATEWIIPQNTNFITQEIPHGTAIASKPADIAQEVVYGAEFAASLDRTKKDFAVTYMQLMDRIFRIADQQVSEENALFPSPSDMRSKLAPLHEYMLGGDTTKPLDLSLVDSGGTRWDIKRDVVPDRESLVQRMGADITYSYPESDVVTYTFHYIGVKYGDQSVPPSETLFLGRLASRGRRRVDSMEISLQPDDSSYKLRYAITSQDEVITRKELHIGADGKILSPKQ